jgi:hypothetical protein
MRGYDREIALACGIAFGGTLGAAMTKNRFEQVDEIQADAITLAFTRTGDRELGKVIFPASASAGRLTTDQISDALPAVEAFRSAIHLANEVKVPIVVIDPEGVWRPEWGELARYEES